MDNRINHQGNESDTQRKNDSKGESNSSVRKLLASSALSTAIISWIATAQGLHVYVFSHYWQAAIISAAIQGTLFAFSIKAISLIKRLNVIGRVSMGILWLCILLSSSIFSYVYISRNVYSDKLLRADSNRIMATYYLEIYSYLDEIIETEKSALELKMAEYIALIGNEEGSIDISTGEKEELDNIKEKIKNYAPESVITKLDNIQSGSYTQIDVEALIELLDNEIENSNSQIKYLETEMPLINSQILEKEGRLKTFINIYSDEYEQVNKDWASLKEQYEDAKKEWDSLCDYNKKLNECKIQVEYINKGLERKLHDESIELRKYLNEDKINTDALIENTQNIYNDLYDNNVSSNDERLIKYKEFKSNVTQYAILVDMQNDIVNERQKIYGVISSNIYGSDDSSENDESDKIIYNDWSELSGNLQNILKDIPQMYFEKYTEYAENESEEYFSKNEIIERIMDMDRLYLSDLNDFERAWTLLWSDIHVYKVLLWFSVIFAFGIDLFSFGTGLLLYFLEYDDENSINKK